MSWFSLHGGAAANRAMADGRRGRELAGVQRVGHQLECHGAVGQSRRLIHQLFAGGVLDPELAQVGADAVDRALEELASVRRCRPRKLKT